MKIIIVFLVILTTSVCCEKKKEKEFVSVDVQNCIDRCFSELMENTPIEVWRNSSSPGLESVKLYREECNEKSKKYMCYARDYYDSVQYSLWEYEIIDKRKIRARR